MDIHGVPSKKDIQAVILAGSGTNLLPLTRHYSSGHNIEESVPKALLPIGNKPMLTFPLAWLEASGVPDVLIICPASHRDAIRNFIHSNSENGSFSSLNIKIQTVDDDDESIGTADVLRNFASNILTDFIVLPCDFIPPQSLSLSKLLNAYRMDTEEPTLTALLYERGEITKEGPPALVAALDEKEHVILDLPMEDGSDELELKMSLMWRSPRVRLTSKYLDSHVYVMRHSVLAILQERTEISSIKEDLVPWLCRAQYRSAPRQKYASVLSPAPNPQALAIQHSTLRPNYTSSLGLPSEKDDEEEEMVTRHRSPPSVSSAPPSQRASPKLPDLKQNWNSHSAERRRKTAHVRCAYVVHELRHGQAMRANILNSYVEANRLRLAEIAQQDRPNASSTAEIDPKAQVSPDSLVGSSTKVGERTSVKKSVIGSHCTIGKNVKITGCVIMDHAVIHDGCKLENTLLSRYVVVNERASLKDCEAATGVAIAASGNFKNEKFEQFSFDE